MKYGVFSEKAAELFGTVFYRTPDGREVEVCSIYNDPECSGFMWEDKVLLGPVDKRSGDGRPMSREMKSDRKFSKKYLDERSDCGTIKS